MDTPNKQQDLLYQIALGFIPQVGAVMARKLVALAGSAEAVFREKKKTLESIPRINTSIAEAIHSAEVMQKAEQELAFIEKEGIRTLYFQDKRFPYRLKEVADAPFLLYLKGDIDLNHKKILAVVGTRKATVNGKNNCSQLIEKLREKNHNPIIASGLAYGIDVCAHQAALTNQLKTVAVLGHGLDLLYPSSHRAIAEKIQAHGALISEFPSGTKMDPRHFIRRNRIIAALSDAVVVVESAARGGSLNTAEVANSYNRDVFAFPGRTNDAASEGCNTLIKRHKANLITNYEDVEYFMGWDQPKQDAVQKKLFVELTPDEQLIYDSIDTEKLHVDLLAEKTKLSLNKLATTLLNMEFKGVIQTLPGKYYGLK